jgi:AcrR family transcriptional regulator
MAKSRRMVPPAAVPGAPRGARAGAFRRPKAATIGATPAARRDGPALSRERIVGAALGIVAADGLAGLSTRKLGQALGCEAMSIYHHFPGKPHLLDALVDAAIGSIPPPPSELPPLERLRDVAYAYRAMAHRYPKLYPLIAVHRLNTPTGVRLIERVLRIVAEMIPGTEAAARFFRVFGYYVTGAALDETAGYARGPSAAEPVSDEFVARECPHLAAAAPYAKAEHWDRTFALGLDALLARLGGPAPAALAGAPPLPKPVIHPKR